MNEQTNISLANVVRRGNFLRSNEVISAGEAIISKNERFYTVIGSDGRLCIYLKHRVGDNADLHHCVMMTGWPEGNYYGILKSNGNFCVNSGSGIADDRGTVWTSNTMHGFESDYFLIMRNDGNLCIYGGKGPDDYREMIWCTDTANPALVRPVKTKPVAENITLGSTMNYPTRTSWSFPAGDTFAQSFRVQSSGTPQYLCIGMGNNQNPYGAHLKIVRGNDTLFERDYTDRKQRSSDWTTVYELDGFNSPLQEGEMITYELTISTGVGFEPVLTDLPDYPKSSTRNGMVAMKFMLNGLANLYEADASVSNGELSDQHLLQIGENGYWPAGKEMKGVLTTNFEVIDQVWNFGGPVITAWLQSPQLGSMVFLNPLTGFALPPKWYYPSQAVFTPEVTVTGIAPDRTPVRTVSDAPTNTITGPTGVTSAGHTVPIGVDGLLYDHVSFGRPREGLSGITIIFEASLSRRATAGRLGVIQFVNGSRRFTKVDGSIFELTTTGGWYLDRTGMSPEVIYDPINATTAIRPGETKSVALIDSPGFELISAFTRVVVNERFRAYLVYMPVDPTLSADTTRWFPVGYTEWSWAVDIARVSATAPWPATTNTSTYTPGSSLGNFVRTNLLPDWNRQGSDYIARYLTEFAGMVGQNPFGFKVLNDILNAVQIEIHLNQSVTAELKGRLAETLKTRISTASRNDRTCLVWMSLADAQRALQVPGVTAINEIPVAQRYSSAHDDVKHTMEVEVAPFSMFRDSPDDYSFAESVSPKSLAMVAAALVEQNAQLHPQTPLDARIFSNATLLLTFTAEIGESLLQEVAAHPQVSMAARAQVFRSDDPPVHNDPLS